MLRGVRVGTSSPDPWTVSLDERCVLHRLRVLTLGTDGGRSGAGDADYNDSMTSLGLISGTTGSTSPITCPKSGISTTIMFDLELELFITSLMVASENRTSWLYIVGLMCSTLLMDTLPAMAQNCLIVASKMGKL
ncbi:hypothetical protein L1987_20791 [Smallanthus sonchifolius]|uniref:Uncharacterized protein n=1 Tax=Smallanthus sonchifolius TaxID=185202 RepID=A0ACB9IUB5_9ASTR|nr:hypothetical protein L1987_20791 [Smallanthus sonchifolius]